MLRHNQNGAALVEFAFVLPILLTLVFGIMEFSILLYDKAVITNASREGARRGVLFQQQGAVETGVITATVTNYTNNNLISFGEPTAERLRITPELTCSDDPPTGGQRSVRVRVEYDYNFLVMDRLVTAIAGPVTLVAQTLMRCE